MKKQELYTSFYNAIKESYLKYLLFGDRSEEKLKPLHKWVGDTIKVFIPDSYNVFFLNGKEVQTEGEYYKKIIDVAVVKRGVDVNEKRVGPKSVFYIPKIEIAISIKFITSNFKQNANNYFENLLGECANLRAKGIKFGHFVVFRDKIPYFERSKKIKHWEILDDYDVIKYIKLFQEKEKFFHAPNFICAEIIHINPMVEEYYGRKPKFTQEDIGKVGEITIQNGINNTNINKKLKNYILNNFNLCQFFNNIKQSLKI